MKRNYSIPQLTVLRLATAAILTVSTEEDYKSEWDDALAEEEQQSDDA